MIEALDLGIAALSVELDGRAYAEGEMTPKALYDHLRGGKLPKTSAVNPELWADAMRPALENGQDVLTLVLSSALSATCQNAFIAAEELRGEFPDRKLIVIDSLCAAIGLGLLVHTAARLRDAGKSIEETAAWIEEHKLNVCHWVTVEDLMHLKRGGRVSAATAVVGTMLNIKPIIRVDDNGRLESLAKCRGRKAALNYLLDRMAESFDPEIDDTVFIGHGDCMEDAKYLEQKVRERFGVQNVHINYIGAVVGAHTGPGVAVLFFYGKKR
jgi:DegV family protein with EDD domain